MKTICEHVMILAEQQNLFMHLIVIIEVNNVLHRGKKKKIRSNGGLDDHDIVCKCLELYVQIFKNQLQYMKKSSVIIIFVQ